MRAYVSKRFPAVFVALLSVIIFIAAGCDKMPLSDGLPEGTSLDDSYHPQAWATARTHGQSYLGDLNSCERCHAKELDGGTSGVSCNQCHSGWQQNCSFCHGGGPDNPTAAPPYDLAGNDDATLLSVGAHTVHLNDGSVSLAFDCSTCHLVPESLDDDGHLDETAGAEVLFSDFAGDSASYDAGKCSSIYCHGPSAPDWASGTQMTCASCHGDDTEADGMSGDHAAHFAKGLSCATCHDQVVDADKAIKDLSLHLDMEISVKLTLGSYDRDSKTCSETCHNDRQWGGKVHPTGWFSRDEHGYTFELGENDCTACHGDDFNGGSSGVSCDECHTNATDAWRTTCTFCHGGTDNETGAPPESVFGETDKSETAVGAHSAHVEEADWHAAYACSECHAAYDAFDDDGHIDQTDAGEVAFDADGLNASSVYTADSASCSALYCHGNGREANGASVWTLDPEFTCTSCHGDAVTLVGLSGQHDFHLALEYNCSFCHKDVVGSENAFVDKTLHINGTADVNLISGDWNVGTHTCANTCHADPRLW